MLLQTAYQPTAFTLEFVSQNSKYVQLSEIQSHNNIPIFRYHTEVMFSFVS